MNQTITRKAGAPAYNFRLTIKLVLVVVIIIISAVAILDFFFLPRLAESNVKRVENINRDLTKLVSRLALASMENRDPALLDKALRELVEQQAEQAGELLRVSIITYPDGIYYGSTTRSFINRKAHNSLLLKLSQNQKEGTSVEIVNYKFGQKTIPALQFLKNIYYEKNKVQHHLATVQVLYNYNAIIQSTRERVLVSSGIILLVAVLVVWIILLPISRDHHRLAVALGEAAEDNYNFRLTPKSKDEIAILFQQYNRLMDHLQEDEGAALSEEFENAKAISANGSPRKKTEAIIRKSEITCLCSRIPEIQAQIEAQQPAQVVDFIRQYLDSMEQVIKENGGQIIKIFGDKVYAVFEGVNSADNAVRAALKLMKKWRKENHENRVLGRQQFNYGIGIHADLGLTGNFDLHYNTYSIVSNVAKISEHLCTCAPKEEILISSGLLDKTTASYQHQVAREIVYQDISADDIYILQADQDLSETMMENRNPQHLSIGDSSLQDDVKTDQIATTLGVQSANPERTFDSSLPDILEETLEAAPLATLTGGKIELEGESEIDEDAAENNENLWGEFSRRKHDNDETED